MPSVTTHTLFLYFVNSFESSNFSKTEAIISLKLSKVFNYVTLKLWEIDTPETVQRIADHPTDEIHKDFEHEELLLGFQFLADMINRLFFILIVVGEIIAFCVTILNTVASHSADGRLDMIKKLDSGS